MRRRTARRWRSGSRCLGPEHPVVASSYNNLGSVYNSQGKLEEALGAYNTAL